MGEKSNMLEKNSMGDVKLVKFEVATPQGANNHPTQAVGTFSMPFESVRHLISEKPLHRRGDACK